MEEKSSPWRRLRRPLLALVIAATVLLAAQLLRAKVGIELSAQSIQHSVVQLGLWAPLGYVLLVMFRQVMVLPSMLLLTSAGLLFGAPVGTLLGGIGITLNAFTLFGCAHMLGRDWVLPRIHVRFPDFDKRANTAGPWMIALMTAHPIGILTPFHLAAGVTGISKMRFFAAVAPAAILRAACFSFLGASLLATNSTGLWIASGALVAVAILPLAHPGLRARILSGAGGTKREAEEDDATPTP